MASEVQLSKSRKRKFSKMIDTIINECENFESPTVQNSHEMQSGFSKISLLYDQLNKNNFSPSNHNQLTPLNRSNLDLYISTKNKSNKKSPSITDILQSTPTDQRTLKGESSVLTFQSIKEEEANQILLSNKRGFAKNWKSDKLGFLSPKPKENQILIPVNIRSPHSSIENSQNLRNLIQLDPISKKSETENSENKLKPPKRFNNRTFSLHNEAEQKTPQRLAKPLKGNASLNIKTLEFSPSQKLKGITTQRIKSRFESSEARTPQYLGEFISKLLEKNLGLKKTSPLKEVILKKHKESKSILLNPVVNEEDEGQYLNPEYRKYNLDLSNKLKIQKIVVAKHQQHRRATLLSFPPLKKSPQF